MSIRVEKAEGLATVIIDRPEVCNAVDRPTADALRKAFEDFEQDSQAKAAVLYGDHGNFCAGADMKAIASGDKDRMNHVKLGAIGPMGPTRITLSKPVIAAIAGTCVAGGLELALWCDLRVAEEDAIFGVHCRKWGVPLFDGGTVRLPRIIGQGRALDMILTGRTVTADEALQIGLATRVVPNGTSRQAAESLAREIAEFPQTCLREDRMSSYEQLGMGIDAALFNEHEHGLQTLESGETRDGAMRFNQKSNGHF